VPDPVSAGAVYVTVAVVVPVAVAVPIVGALGTVKLTITCHLFVVLEYVSTALSVVLNLIYPFAGFSGLCSVVPDGRSKYPVDVLV
jgi:hypothetical protein